MNKRVVKILIIFLVLISISTMCYAGFAEVNISEEIPMNFLKRMQIFFKYLISNLTDSFLFLDYTLYYSHSTLFGIEYDYYILAGIIILYTIINCLIVRKKKELLKLSLKINIIILLIILAISISLISIIRVYSSKLMISLTLILLIISLIFQKIISKKDNEIMKKCNGILKVIMLIFVILQISICIITYKYLFLNSLYGLDDVFTIEEFSLYKYLFGDVESGDQILVEVMNKNISPWYPTNYEIGKYTISIGESIRNFSENKVLNIDDEGILLEYIEFYCKENTNSDIDSNNNNFTLYEILNGCESYSEKVQKKLKWETWYSYGVNNYPTGTVMTEGDCYEYIRITKNK